MASDIAARIGLEWEALQVAHLPAIERIRDNVAPEQASRRAVIVEVEEVRRSCADLRARIDVQGLEDRLATSRWTGRQVVAHLASWATRTRFELDALIDGLAVPETIHFEQEGGPQAWNQHQVHVREGRSLSSLFDELDTELLRIADAVVTVPESRLRAIVALPRTVDDPPVPWRLSIAAMVIGSCWHTRYHLTRLEGL